jgi:hypothetical protein
MAWAYAELDSSNIVLQAIVVADADGDDETNGELFCQFHTGSTNRWVKGCAAGTLRKNHPGIGYLFDDSRDAFREVAGPYPSWALDEDTCRWEAPTPMPDNGNAHVWDEDTTSWIDLEIPDQS